MAQKQVCLGCKEIILDLDEDTPVCAWCSEFETRNGITDYDFELASPHIPVLSNYFQRKYDAKKYRRHGMEPRNRTCKCHDCCESAYGSMP